MKAHLFEDLLALDQEFEHVMRGLERVKSGSASKKEAIR